MDTETISALRQRLLYEGLCEVGFSRIDDTVPPDLARYHYAVTLMYRLSDAVLDEIENAPTYAYFQHYRAANALLDRCALITCEFLRREGAAAYPIAASQSVHDRGDKYTGIYQHKSAAVAAGLGWIGKSALFISPEHGPRVRLATVLTDAELPCDAAPMESRCGNCRLHWPRRSLRALRESLSIRKAKVLRRIILMERCGNDEKNRQKIRGKSKSERRTASGTGAPGIRLSRTVRFS